MVAVPVCGGEAKCRVNLHVVSGAGQAAQRLDRRGRLETTQGDTETSGAVRPLEVSRECQRCRADISGGGGDGGDGGDGVSADK